MEQRSAHSPDFILGIDLSSLTQGIPIRGRVGETDALMVKSGDQIFVVGALCSHYQAPLGEGLIVDEEVRCPWHHARFSLRTGEALCAPAFDAIKAWNVVVEDGKAFVRERVKNQPTQPLTQENHPKNIVILGAGGAGFSAAFTLRNKGYQGSIDMISADGSLPYDRPNLSKDYLAGKASLEWLPMRSPDWYKKNNVSIRLNTRATKLEPSEKKLTFSDGDSLTYGRLLLATGAEPIRLNTPGAELAHVFYLRSLADCNGLIDFSKNATRALVIGASFIGLEVAAALKTRGLDVHVVAPESVPMARILGPEIGDFILKLHQQHGVTFHLEDVVTEIDTRTVKLKSGKSLEADFIVIGVGVKPNLLLAEEAGLKIDKGVVVDSFLQTSDKDIYAAGDIARWPDKISGQNIRVEHWAVAERHGQIAAQNMLGANIPFDAPPFFWSQHYDQTISYVGNAPMWNRHEMSGNPDSGNCAVTYFMDNHKLAVATIGRDLQNLCAELAFEKELEKQEIDLNNIG